MIAPELVETAAELGIAITILNKVRYDLSGDIKNKDLEEAVLIASNNMVQCRLELKRRAGQPT